MRYLSHHYTPTEFTRLKGWFTTLLQYTKPKEVKDLERTFLRTHQGNTDALTPKERKDYEEAITAHIKQRNVEFQYDFGVELRGTWTFDLSDGWFGDITLKLGDNDFFHDYEDHMHVNNVAIYSLFIQRWDLLGAAG